MQTAAFKRMLSIFCLALLPMGVFPQSQSYHDVAVIINSASSISDSVGSYFALQRDLPTQNIVRIIAPITEEIDSTSFEELRAQVEAALVARGLRDSVNFLVTTKGMPLKVKRSTRNACSSVESELSLILGPYANSIGKDGRIVSPYYTKRENFLRTRFGIYLVTRLDGYTFADIKGLIDRSSTTLSAAPAGTFVFDEDPSWSSGGAAYLNANLRLAASQLSARGFHVILDTTAIFLTNQSNVMGYTSWGSNDRSHKLFTENGKPRNVFLPGALAETYVSTSSRTFQAPPLYGQSLIADLIAEGVTGVKGYVYEPLASAMASAQTLFPMYVDGFALAECYYSASCYLSWMDVVIGDPKYRLVASRIEQTTPLPVQFTDFRGQAVGATVTLTWRTETEVEITGFEIHRRRIAETVNGEKVLAVNDSQWSSIGFVRGSGTGSSSRDYSLLDRPVSPGRYSYRVTQIDLDGSQRVVGSIDVTVGEPEVAATALGNFPNPFNAQTNIRFSLLLADDAVLRVFSLTGEVVAELFRGHLAPGSYQFPFEASRLASGMYLIELQTSHQHLVQKMLLLK